MATPKNHHFDTTGPTTGPYWTTTGPLWPYCGPTETEMSEMSKNQSKWPKFTKMSENQSKWQKFTKMSEMSEMSNNSAKWPKCLKNKGPGAPGPIPRWHTTVRTVPGTPIPRVPTPPARLLPGACYPCLRARHRSPGFFWIQGPSQNTKLSKTTTFLDHFWTCQNWQNPENWPAESAGIHEKCQNDRFWRFLTFLTIFETPLVFTGFSWFLLFWDCQVFPWTLSKCVKMCQNVLKNTKNTENHENVTDRSDTWESGIFVKKMTLFRQNWHFP